MTQTPTAGALSRDRVLDLPTERSWLTGKLLADLADLGASVPAEIDGLISLGVVEQFEPEKA